MLLGDAGALEPGGRKSRFSCCAIGDLKFDVRCVLVVGTPFVPSRAESRSDEKGSVDSGWARWLLRLSSIRVRAVENSCLRGVLEIRDKTVGRDARGRANAGVKNGSTLGCARSSISAVLRRSIVVKQITGGRRSASYDLGD